MQGRLEPGFAFEAEAGQILHARIQDSVTISYENSIADAGQLVTRHK